MFDEKEMIIITIKYIVTVGFLTVCIVVVVELLFYVHGKHLRSCRDGQLT